MDRNKKIFIVILTLLVLIAAGLLIYYFFFMGEGGEEPAINPPLTPPVITPGTPGGGGSPVTPGGATPGGGTSSGLPSAFKPILRQITITPTAGGIIFDKSGKPTVRYVERAKGNVYETDAVSIKATRLSNTTVPQIYEAFWKNSGDRVIARLLKDNNTIQTFDAVVAPRSGGEGELRGEFLTNNIKDLSVSSSGNQIFYLVPTYDGISGIVASFDGVKKIQIFESPLREWVSEWPNDKTVAVTSKAGVGSEGLMMFVDAGTGKQQIVLSGIAGLTTLTNSDLSKVLYSNSTLGAVSNQIFSVADKTSELFPLTTLPEKCVWSQIQKMVIYCAVPEILPSANYPDDWYRGSVSFRDELWKFDIVTGNSTFIMNLGDQSREDFDAVRLSLNDKESYLLLTNKNDLTLWEVQLSQ